MRLLACLFVVVGILAWDSAAESIPRGDIIPHHSMEPPFVHDWWEEGVPHWDVGGDAVATNEMIRLTPQRASRFGWAWNSQRNDNPWWEVKMQFYIRSRQNPGADGLAFWYAQEPYKGREPGPLFGMPADFKGIGVLFDSYDNDHQRDNPATMVISNVRGETNQWNLDSDLIDQSAFRCLFDHRNTADGDPVEMVLQYYQRRLTLRMRTVLRSSSEAFCGEISDIELPMDWTFGATATTGALSDNHDIISIEVRPLGDPIGDPSIPQQEGRLPQPRQFDHEADSKEKDYWRPKDAPAE
jgi:mannose-binding lectin 1